MCNEAERKVKEHLEGLGFKVEKLNPDSKGKYKPDFKCSQSFNMFYVEVKKCNGYSVNLSDGQIENFYNMITKNRIDLYIAYVLPKRIILVKQTTDSLTNSFDLLNIYDDIVLKIIEERTIHATKKIKEFYASNKDKIEKLGISEEKFIELSFKEHGHKIKENLFGEDTEPEVSP